MIPVSLADAKAQLRVEQDDGDRDPEIEGFIADAAAWVERYTGHILTAHDVTETFECFTRPRLRSWPIKPDAEVAVIYLDAVGAPVTVGGARLLFSKRWAQAYPAIGSRWPAAPSDTVVSVTVRAGYEDDDPVPGNLRRAMLVLIAGYDADREGGNTFAKAEAAARSLCSDFRRRRL